MIVGASLLKVREQLLAAADPRADPGRRPGCAPSCATTSATASPGSPTSPSLGLGACLADDMGLGKTITLIALHLHRVEAAAADARSPTLVVCPASLLGNWEAEIRRFAPGVAVRRFHGGARARLDGPTGGFVLTTYGTMRRDHATLAAVPWDLVVADEAQHVKNSRSSTARALRAIPSAARVALTGTPVENDLTELWSILDWAIPGLLGSRHAFRKVWAAPIESGLEPTKARQFADLIGPFLLRRRKSDPGIAPELPAEDRDRPPDRPDPRAGRALRGLRPRHRWSGSSAPRRGDPARAGARAADRAQADLQPPGAVPQAVRRGRASPAARRSSSCSTSCSAPCSPRTARCWSSRSTSRWRG